MPPKGRRTRRTLSQSTAEMIVPPDVPVRCDVPGCNCDAEPVSSLDMLRDTRGDILCISRQQGDTGEWRQIAVGKFSEWAVEQLVVTGDRILFSDGRRIEVLARS